MVFAPVSYTHLDVYKRQVYRTAYEQGDGFCSVRFADRELYEQAFSYFITDQKIVHYCKGLTSLYYLEDSDQNVLTIKF